MKLSTMLKLEQMVDTLEKGYGGTYTVDLETAGYIKELIECKDLLIQIGIEIEEDKEVDYNSYKDFNEKINNLKKENDELRKELRKCRENYTELQRKSEEEVKNLKLINEILIKNIRDQNEEIKELKKVKKEIQIYMRFGKKIISKEYTSDDNYLRKIEESYEDYYNSDKY